MTQADRILEFLLEWGTITPYQAFEQLGITKLSTRISEMRAAGVKIKREMVNDINRYGDPVRYCRYSLEEENA